MAYKVLELECLRCHHIWTTRPTMIKKDKDGIPRICPDCKKYLRTINIASYRILRHITTWGGELTELTEEDKVPGYKKPRKLRQDKESPEYKTPKQKEKTTKPSNDNEFFNF
jgi:NAD-dependent SIR2 family protein deacetylase